MDAVEFFVAEDLIHESVGSPGSFVSRCGYEYARDAVEWAGEYEPEAWPQCEECSSDAREPLSAESVVIRGVYALDDDAHLWTSRDAAGWSSICGRTDPEEQVAWAGDDWPEAYDRCPECVRMVEADLDQGDDGREIPRPPDNGEAPVPRKLLAARLRDYHVWVIQDGTEHRPRNQNMDAAMCGRKLDGGLAPRLHPTEGVQHCHECDRAVGLARAARKPKRSSGPRQRTGGARKSVVAPTKPAKPSGSKRRKDRATEKEKALFGRKMIVPVRFVSGGLPTLGRRR